jgi:hypothetical protein
MPYVTLKYKLPEEKDDHTLAIKGHDMYCVLWDLDQYLRQEIKYKILPKSQYEVLETVRHYLWDLLKDRDIDLDGMVE